jgi:membrane protein implicated in regulation of membrane protease activity
MLIRLLGEGCLTWLITIIEVTTVFFSVLLSIFIRQFAIFIAVVFVFAAVYNGKKRYDKRKEEQEEQEEQQQQQQQMQHVTSVEDGVPEGVVANFSRTSDEIEIEKVGTTTTV